MITPDNAFVPDTVEEFFNILQKACDGDATAGRCVLDPIFFTLKTKAPFIDRARDMLLEHAAENDFHATALGMLLVQTGKTKTSIMDGISWTTRAAHHGYPTAIVFLAALYSKWNDYGAPQILINEDGNGHLQPCDDATPSCYVPDDLTPRMDDFEDEDEITSLAVEWNWAAYALGERSSLYAIADIIDMDEDLEFGETDKWEVDIDRLRREFSALLKTGDPEALWHYSYLLNGVLFPANIAKRRECLLLSANQGFLYAIRDVANGLLGGDECFRKAPKEAVKWLEKGCAAGDGDCFNTLGNLYRDGKHGIKRNLAKAYECFLKGANIGFPPAMVGVGICLRDGIGTTAAPEEGFKWLRKAAKEGNPFAWDALSECYEKGLGVQKDMAKAREYHEKSKSFFEEYEMDDFSDEEEE